MRNSEKITLMNIGMMILGMAFMVMFIRGCFSTGTSAPLVAMWLLLALMCLHWSKQVFRTRCWLRRMKKLGAGTPREQKQIRLNILWWNACGAIVILTSFAWIPMISPGDEMAEVNMVVFSLLSGIFYMAYREFIKKETVALRAVCRRQK